MSAELEAKLADAKARLVKAEQDATAFDARARAEWDPAMGSGIRRKPNAKADRARLARSNKEVAMWKKAHDIQNEIAKLESRIAHAKRIVPIPFTDEQWKAARAVRTAGAWHRVVRMNAKSATVETPYSWTDRVPRDRVIEVRV